MTYSALARRRQPQTREPVLRLITFQLRHNRFCLPLAQARRVIHDSSATPAARLGLTQLQQNNIPIVDIATLVYRNAPALPGQVAALPLEMAQVAPGQTILVVESNRLGLLGLLVDNIPTLNRAKASAFSPVPAAYLIINHLQGINTLVTLGEAQPPVFLLELESLLP
ncbi:MAG: chemotaxis protein CheW [Nodosilinea sp.]